MELTPHFQGDKVCCNSDLICYRCTEGLPNAMESATMPRGFPLQHAGLRISKRNQKNGCDCNSIFCCAYNFHSCGLQPFALATSLSTKRCSFVYWSRWSSVTILLVIIRIRFVSYFTFPVSCAPSLWMHWFSLCGVRERKTACLGCRYRGGIAASWLISALLTQEKLKCADINDN